MQSMDFFHQMGTNENFIMNNFIGVLLITTISSVLIMMTYIFFTDKKLTNLSDIFISFPTIALATSSIFMTLQFSIPLSLGLLGSLSIVRFRTPVKNPVDIGFLLVLIASSLLASTKNFKFVLILNLALIIISILLKHFSSKLSFGGGKNISRLLIEFGADTKSVDSVIEGLFSTSDSKDFKTKSITQSNNQIFINIEYNGEKELNFNDLQAKLPAGGKLNIYNE